ncbi:NRAMP (natural resistance-associated macrophage protein) metal ion transporters [Bryocella elongata]|uniref:NRAMP (Natural resistance-associated macrophage protein) metal ion transporters n=1 Tax=Bryocella elongata TaxID=863522 RepID=A0A1H6AYY2_9BACT|nr:Nramp family divalent metal transporter [Bryocella elongata]SEG53833.1 NRAMP (natural resistance-associated macrophage protein) metal ion transporters [Bryocella elongata]
MSTTIQEIHKTENTNKGVRVRSGWQRNVVAFLMAFGPGLIVMEADNDAGAVSTYMQAGGQYGLHLLWTLLLLMPICYFTQEMVARLGIATGKGHAAMIYERFGKWWGRFSLIDLLAVNFLTLITEFAAISLAMSGLGVSPVISVPLAAVALIALVASGSYRRWERIVVCLCLLDLAWFVTAALLHPQWHDALHNAIVPSIPKGGITGDLVFLVIGIVGTTIAPWQLFFQQSCVAEKRLRFSDLKWARLDTLIGAVFTVCVAGAMMLVGAFAYNHGIAFTDPAQLAEAIAKVLPARTGTFVHHALLLLMVNAAVLGTTAISLASSWAYGEVVGWEHSMHKKITEAPGFYGVYAACIFAAAGIVLIPRLPLQLVIVSVQVFAGLMLPSAIIFLQLLLNDRALLGDEWVNKPWNNWINWTIVGVLFALSIVLAAQVLLPSLFR